MKLEGARSPAKEPLPPIVFPVEPERRSGVFLKLLDTRVFNAVTVNPDFGCVEWPGGGSGKTQPGGVRLEALTPCA